MSIEEMWNTLLILGVSEETLNIVKCINGYSKETMQDILYATTGYKSFEQIDIKKFHLSKGEKIWQMKTKKPF